MIQGGSIFNLKRSFWRAVDAMHTMDTRLGKRDGLCGHMEASEPRAVTKDLKLTHVNHASSPLSLRYALFSHITHRTASITTDQILPARSISDTAYISPQIHSHRGQ